MRKWMQEHGQGVRRALAALAVMGLTALAYRAYGWPGLGLALGGGVMWGLLHMTRMLTVLRRTAQNPVGSIASAVMFHARLARGMSLLQVLALTRSLGQSISEPHSEPMRYQWTDGSMVTVHCTFADGKLVQWELLRP